MTLPSGIKSVSVFIILLDIISISNCIYIYIYIQYTKWVSRKPNRQTIITLHNATPNANIIIRHHKS